MRKDLCFWNIVKCFILYLFVDLEHNFCGSSFSVPCDNRVWRSTSRYPQFSCRYCTNRFEPDDVSSLKYFTPRQSNQFLRRDYIQQIIFTYIVCSINSIAVPIFSTESFITSAFAPTSQRKGDKSVSYPVYDVPNVSPNCFRLYLVRHGETENNRLHLVQGARVDASLNDTGEKQAKSVGRALSILHSNKNNDDLLFLHSNLKRSKETAQIAASTYLKCKKSSLTNDNDGGDYEQKKQVKLLSSIGEIDFGLQEGKPSSSVRSDMFQTYSSWSVGFIDIRSADGSGESGREVLDRIENSFNSFVEISRASSSKPWQDIVAVSHGQFIRMMLAVALDMPLFQAFTTIQQKNACINILDISYTEKVTRRAKNCNLFGGALLSRITDDNLTIVLPKINVVCIGETRHLQGFE